VAKRKEGLAFDTLDRVYKAFKTMLNHAVKTGYLEQNPIKDISLTRYHTQKKADEHNGTVFFSDEEIRSILQALDDYQEEKRQQRDNSRQHGRDYLPDLRFTNPDTGKPYSKKAEQKPWQKIKKLAGIADNVKLYSLRHTYISRLIVQGTDLLTVAKLAGHKSTQMIEKHYGHLRPDRTRQSIEDCFKGFAVASEAKSSRDHKPLKTGQN